MASTTIKIKQLKENDELMFPKTHADAVYTSWINNNAGTDGYLEEYNLTEALKMITDKLTLLTSQVAALQIENAELKSTVQALVSKVNS